MNKYIAALEQQKRKRRTQRAEYPEYLNDSGFAPAAELEMMMDRRHAENAFSVRNLKITDLDHDGQCLDYEYHACDEYIDLELRNDRNPDKRSNFHDVFVLGGLVVSPSEFCDLDLGFRYSVETSGSESPAADYSVLAGFTVRYDGGAKKEGNQSYGEQP